MEIVVGLLNMNDRLRWVLSEIRTSTIFASMSTCGVATSIRGSVFAIASTFSVASRIVSRFSSTAYST